MVRFSLAIMRLVSKVNNGQYAEFVLDGETGLTEMIRILTDVHEQCLTDHINGALVDLTPASGNLTGIERFKLARAVAPTWNREIRLAAIITQPQALPGKFAELVAQNLGLRVRVFTDRPKAIAWLESTFRRA